MKNRVDNNDNRYEIEAETEHKNEELGLTWVAKWLACVQQLKWYTFNETYHLEVLKRA